LRIVRRRLGALTGAPPTLALMLEISERLRD
jgi:hypothetical protein